MQKLDRLRWAGGLVFEAYGMRMGVRSSEPGLLDRILEVLPPGSRPAADPEVDYLFSLRVGRDRGTIRGYHLLYLGVIRRARTLDPEEALATLEADLRQAVAARSRRLVFVHAGVVGLGGRAILLPGRSHSGKTTLVSELVRAGASYYSDEFALLDDRGRVHPFAKPLAIREGKAVHRCPVEELGGTAGTEPLRVGAVVFAEHRRGARWRPVRQTAGQALLALLSHTVPVRRRPRAALTALERALARATVLRGVRGEAREAAQALVERFGDWPAGVFPARAS